MSVRMILNLKLKIVMILLASLVTLESCSSSKKTTYQGYQPKYKKPKPNKPLPCPMKDC